MTETIRVAAAGDIHCAEPLIAHLKMDWPDTLKAWDVLQQEVEAFTSGPLVFDEPWDKWLPEPARAICMGP